MTFQELVTPNAFVVVSSVVTLLIVMIGLVSIFFGIISVINYYLDRKKLIENDTTHEPVKSGWRFLVSVVALTIMFANLAIITNQNVSDIEQQNAQKFTDNLKQKYSISEIVEISGEDDLSYHRSLAKLKEKTIEVKTQDGTRVNFLITVDRNTFEPTLENPAIDGGAGITTSVNAKDLLKK